MSPTPREALRYGAVAAGALVIGGTGAAVADQLIDSGDIKNKSIKLKDLSQKLRDDVVNETIAPDTSLLVSRASSLSSDVNNFIGPGTDNVNSFDADLTQVLTPPVPTAGLRFRGLAVRTYDSKTGDPLGDYAFTLQVNGADTALSCTTAGVEKTCSATGDVVAPPGSELVVKAFGSKQPFVAATVTLALGPA